MNIELNMRKGKLGNKNRRKLEIIIVEHVYDGSPRWRENVKKTFRKHSKDVSSPYGRERSVNNTMHNAWGRDYPGEKSVTPQAKFSEGIWDLITCTNPDCKKRSQHVLKGTNHTHADVFPHKCDCNKSNNVPILHFQLINQKWIYVLTGDGNKKKLAYEIYAKNEKDWLVLKNPDASRPCFPAFEGNGKHKRVYGSGARLAVKAGETYSFFLSPIQLGKNGLKNLVNGTSGDKKSGKRENKKSPQNEQLDALCITRKFFDLPKQIRDPNGKRINQPEYVAVIDPFAFAVEVKEWDFFPIAIALYQLKFDKSERAKLNIASILTALIGEKKDDKFEDKFDLIDEIEKSGAQIKGSHTAEEWLKTYNQCMKFLSEYIQAAALRLTEWLECDAHWLVEQAIVERAKNPDILAMGISHFTNIIKDFIASSVGQSYITRTESNKKNGFICKYILYPQAPEKKAIKELRKKHKYGDIPAPLLALMMPVIMNKPGKNDRAKIVVEHLKAIGIDAVVTGNINLAPGFGYKGMQLVKNTLLAIDDARIERVGKSYLPPRIHDRVKPALKVFTKYESHIEATFNLFAGIKIYTEKSKPGDSAMDQAIRTKTQWEYPFQALKYTTDMSKLGMAIWVKKKYGFAIADLANARIKPSDTVKLLLMSDETLTVLSRSANFYSAVSRASRYLTGPVALVFGGIDMLIQTRQVVVSWGNGDPGTSVGSAMLLSAAGLGVTSAVIECLSLIGIISPASALSMLGPIGIIAAVVSIGAMLVFALFSKSDLEKYANHCFLGNEYGQGYTGIFAGKGPNWANGIRYKSWKNWPETYVIQHVYLINLLSSVKALIRHHSIMGSSSIHYGVFVSSGYLPFNSRCEVIITGNYMDKKKGKPVYITAKVYVDITTGEYVAICDKKYPMPSVSVYAVPDDSWGKKTFGYFAVAVDYRSGEVDYVYEKNKYGQDIWAYSNEVKFRFDIGGQNYIPNGFDETHYLELHNLKSGAMGEMMKKWP